MLSSLHYVVCVSVYLWAAFQEASRVTPNVRPLTGNAGEILICWHSVSLDCAIRVVRGRGAGNSG